MTHYILVFIPAVIAIIYGLFNEYRHKSNVGSLTITILTILVVLRFAILSLSFDGVEMTKWESIAESMSSMYIITFMYMYLCDMCGTKWNNNQGIFMLILPIIALLHKPILNIGGVAENFDDAVEGAFNLYSQGKLAFHLMIRPTIVIICCLTVAYCMIRLHVRIRKYGLKFTPHIVFYYFWMFFMLGFTSLTFILSMQTSTNETVRWIFLIGNSLIITTGYAVIPNSFKVAPIVNKMDNKPVESLDNFIEQNQHLANHLHQLMEEDKIYLQPSLFIDDVATMMGTNRTYVTKLMRQEFGQTYTDYVNNARVIYSKKLLLTTSMTLEEIAQASGFSSASAYCRVFKRLTDTTPIAWKTGQSEE